MSARRGSARLASRLAALGAFLGAGLGAPPVLGSPEWNAGVTTSLCALGEDGEYAAELGWCNALHADVLFGRRRNSDFALGPYVDLSTRDFDDLRWGGGASLLLPIADDLPLVLSAGPYVNGVDHLGLETSVFWGLRTYNFHGSYGMSGGLVLSAQHDFGDRRETTLLAGVRLDVVWLLAPFVLGYALIAGP